LKNYTFNRQYIEKSICVLKDNFVDEETIKKFKNWKKFNGYRGGSENFFKCNFKKVFVSFGIIFLI
jgi:hypothetical protein